MNFVSKDFFEIHLIAEIQAKNIGKKFLEYHFRGNVLKFSKKGEYLSLEFVLWPCFAS